jgi:hypothetical protein
MILPLSKFSIAPPYDASPTRPPNEVKMEGHFYSFVNANICKVKAKTHADVSCVVFPFSD